MKKDVYKVITDKILRLLDEGAVPWHKPWASSVQFPRNLVSGKRYRGVNAFCLACSDYTSSYWLMFKQAKDRGGSIKKEEKGSPCVYWNWADIEDKDTGEILHLKFIRYHTVFIAEMGSTFLCGHTGIEAQVIDNSASHIDNWRRTINKDPGPVILTAAQAQGAVDNTLSVKYDNSCQS